MCYLSADIVLLVATNKQTETELNRKEYVSINDIVSPAQEIKLGVPHGLVLEPILFLL